MRKSSDLNEYEKIWYGIVGFIAIIVMITPPTYWLWNWLCPVLFGLPQITIWQAMGLLTLSGLLFRGSR
jgi:hypothetical protein